MKRGEKLSAEKIAKVQRLLDAGLTIQVVSERLGLARSTVSDIKLGKRHAAERVA